MTIAHVRVVLLATILAAICAPVLAATPTPTPSPHPIHLPAAPLHTEYVVEVNDKGQVVRVKSSKVSANQAFNVITFGNALQMWIRKPDGSATVGLFKVSYDYDPKSQKVGRGVQLVSIGGTWGGDEGAALKMLDTAKQQIRDAQKQWEQQHNGSALPSMKDITGQTPSPSPSPL